MQGQIRTISSIGNSAAFLVSGLPGRLYDLDGTTLGSAVYLQLFDSSSASVGSIGSLNPLKEMYVTAAGGLPSLFQSNVPIPFYQGLVVGLSSTQGHYTASNANTDYLIDLEEWEPSEVSYDQTLIPGGPTLSVVGDLTTALNSKVVWADGAGPQFIRRIICNELLGAARIVVALTASQTGVIIGPLKANAVNQIYEFGDAGFCPQSKDASNVLHNGCTIVLWNSITTNSGGVLIGPTTANCGTIKAYYNL